METVEHIYPSEEELSQNKTVNACSECTATFGSESNLKLHLKKTHKKTELLQPNNQIYHCPITSCTYHHKNFKFMKQHYLKLHSKRDYACNLCYKKFPTEWYLKSHVDYCNVRFKCCDCDASYGVYETLKTHSRRKKHLILEKSKYKMNLSVPVKDQPLHLGLNNENAAATKATERLILPKPMVIYINTSEQGSQTDCHIIQQKSQETQTVLQAMEKPQFSVETQTISNDYSTNRLMTFENKNMITQTDIREPQDASCNTSFPLDELDLIMNEVQRSSSSTQTNLRGPIDMIYSSSTSTHDSIHTVTSDLLTDTFDSNFFNSNMETQTEFMLKDDILRCCDYYSDMHTQTCQDLILGAIELNDNETQTVLNYMLKSVESQTVMSQSKLLPVGCKDMSHMETQTDIEFKQLLEKINA